jgi:hypothetical protein
MKPEYKPWRDVMLDSMGRFRTTGLFWELRKNNEQADKYPPLFTIKPRDHTVESTDANGNITKTTYRSLKAIYFSYDHLPEVEYDFALDIFGNWDHWIWLATKSSFRDTIKAWREELDIKIRSAAMKTILEQSRDLEKGLSAARMIVGNEHKGSKRGRPSSAEVVRQQKIEAGIRDNLQEDMDRLGIKVVK